MYVKYCIHPKKTEKQLNKKKERKLDRDSYIEKQQER